MPVEMVPYEPTGLLLDIVTPAYAIVEPPLVGYGLTDARLLRYISAASAWVQRYLHWPMTEEDVASLPEDIKIATVRLVVVLLDRSDEGADADLFGESLGDYSYTRARRETPGGVPASVTDLLTPYIKRVAPIVL